jgi:hypothetical protein
MMTPVIGSRQFDRVWRGLEGGAAGRLQINGKSMMSDSAPIDSALVSDAKPLANITVYIYSCLLHPSMQSTNLRGSNAD